MLLPKLVEGRKHEKFPNLLICERHSITTAIASVSIYLASWVIAAITFHFHLYSPWHMMDRGNYDCSPPPIRAMSKTFFEIKNPTNDAEGFWG